MIKDEIESMSADQIGGIILGNINKISYQKIKTLAECLDINTSAYDLRSRNGRESKKHTLTYGQEVSMHTYESLKRRGVLFKYVKNILDVANVLGLQDVGSSDIFIKLGDHIRDEILIHYGSHNNCLKSHIGLVLLMSGYRRTKRTRFTSTNMTSGFNVEDRYNNFQLECEELDLVSSTYDNNFKSII